MNKSGLFFLLLFAVPVCLFSQLLQPKAAFTYADTLRGSITKYRVGWDVQHYDLTVQPDIAEKTIRGQNTITFKQTQRIDTMQIDLQQPLLVDSIVEVGNGALAFKRENNVCFIVLPAINSNKYPANRKITVYYHGRPLEAVNPPWSGGISWRQDEKGRPFIGTSCQGLGASVWWPCKDHQSDEPDNGMNINIIAPAGLQAVSNGRLLSTTSAGNGLTLWAWQVVHPINTYCVTMNIGNYVMWKDKYKGEGGQLDLAYWVIDYNEAKARRQFTQVKPMLKSHEYWFAKYPFYSDGFKLIETSFLGMEHQSGVAYGNKYMTGYRGKDLSNSGFGLQFDYIIIHESGHEWFGNNITSKDIADMWIHESFTTYSEVLYVNNTFGKNAADNYCYGLRGRINNDKTIIGSYGVNSEGSGDMYFKGANMLHSIRNAFDNDALFRDILRGLNQKFFHRTVTTAEVEKYIEEKSRLNLSVIFDQYLRTTQVPVFEYKLAKNGRKIMFRYTNCNDGFNLPLYVNVGKSKIKLLPTTNWSSVDCKENLTSRLLEENLIKRYYLQLQEVKG